MKTFLTILIRTIIILVGLLLINFLVGDIEPPSLQFAIEVILICVLSLLAPKVKLK